MLDLQVASAQSAPDAGEIRLSAIWAWECPSHRDVYLSQEYET